MLAFAFCMHVCSLSSRSKRRTLAIFAKYEYAKNLLLLLILLYYILTRTNTRISKCLSIFSVVQTIKWLFFVFLFILTLLLPSQAMTSIGNAKVRFEQCRINSRIYIQKNIYGTFYANKRERKRAYLAFI